MYSLEEEKVERRRQRKKETEIRKEKEKKIYLQPRRMVKEIESSKETKRKTDRVRYSQ